MSKKYDEYLEEHRRNVIRGFKWIKANLPDIVENIRDYERNVFMLHDQSKYNKEEYDAYDLYFYGGNRSFEVVQNFNKAWLRHIHQNPHHWQHWVLINDDPKEGEVCVEIPIHYILEMICDWWSFSWKNGNLMEIFKWYDEHKEYIKMHKTSRRIVEDILYQIKNKLTNDGYKNVEQFEE